METQNFQFLSSDQKTQIHAIKWIPKSQEKIKCILQITHGMIEFIERYSEFAEFLCNNGILAIGHDHLGHGESILSKEDWGYIGEPNPGDLLVSDMHKLREIIQKENPNVPYFMLGHSMGSYLLRKYISFHSEGLAGAIIVGTGFESGITTNLGIGTIKTMALIKGWRHKSDLVEKMVFGGSAYKKYDLTYKDLTNSWLSKDTEVVRKYSIEPKNNFKFSLNGYYALLDTVRFSCDEKNVRKININLPVFIISGNDDPVGNNGEGVKKCYNLMKKAQMIDITMKLYKNDRHEILNETDKKDVFNDVLQWITSKIKE